MTTELEEFLRSPAAAETTADAEGRLLRPGTVLDGMEVVAFLGAGATAEVWRVRKDDATLRSRCSVRMPVTSTPPASVS